MRYMLKNVAAICEAAGTTLENVVRRACFHDTGERFAETMEEWATHFPERKPCSTTLIIGGPLVVPGAHTLLDLIAFVPTKVGVFFQMPWQARLDLAAATTKRQKRRSEARN